MFNISNNWISLNSLDICSLFNNNICSLINKFSCLWFLNLFYSFNSLNSWFENFNFLILCCFKNFNSFSLFSYWMFNFKFINIDFSIFILFNLINLHSLDLECRLNFLSQFFNFSWFICLFRDNWSNCLNFLNGNHFNSNFSISEMEVNDFHNLLILRNIFILRNKDCNTSIIFSIW